MGQSVSSAPGEYSGMSTHEVSEDQFWKMVDGVGWPDVDIDSAKIKLMQLYDARTMARFREIFQRKNAELSDAAAVDWCCDSWDDTRAHIVGLGQVEYERNLLNPSLIRDRYHNCEFRESFAYCLPFSEDYDLLSDSAYVKRLKDVHEFMSELDAADPDDIPPRLYRRFDEVRELGRTLLASNWSEAVRMYHAAYGHGYADDWPFKNWCGYLIPNIIRDLERYRLTPQSNG